MSTWNSTNTMPTSVSGPASELPRVHRADQRAGRDRDQRGEQAAQREQRPTTTVARPRRGSEQRAEELVLLATPQSSPSREASWSRAAIAA